MTTFLRRLKVILGACYCAVLLVLALLTIAPFRYLRLRRFERQKERAMKFTLNPPTP